jgi:ABC-type dipeptide/oligopeptide/nickel transport system permease component
MHRYLAKRLLQGAILLIVVSIVMFFIIRMAPGGPAILLQQDITKALDAFAKARGITMVLDGSQLQGIYTSDTSIDITRAFINDFNSKNPATASVTTP